MGVSQVPIWTVPFRKNPFFTGREEILAQLHTLLQDTHKAALSQSQSLAISGLGGIGKTQTAVEYAYRYRDEYEVVCWLKSDRPQELAENFASIARLLQLPEQGAQEQSRIVEAVKGWFETHTHWLLIFDNADNLATLTDYLPQSNTGHVIITTRANTTGDVAMKIEMPVMKREEGIRLLLERAKIIKQMEPLEQVGEVDLHLAGQIVDELGGLPLALDQAGAYLEETGTSLSNYLYIFKDHRAELLQRRGGVKPDHAPVATTWTLAFENLELNNPAVIELIRLYAFLAPDEIPEELLGRTAHLLNPSLQTLASNLKLFEDAIEALRSYSLIQRDRTGKTLSIHRLVQAVIKDGLSKTQQMQWAEQIVRMICHMFPFEEPAPWTNSQRYLSHALLAVGYIRQWSFTFLEARDLLYNLGIYFDKRGQYNEAEPPLLLSKAFTEKYVGHNHVETVHRLVSLAILYKEQGKYEKAEPLYQRALAINEQQLGPDHPDTASYLNNLAVLYKKQDKYEQAEPLYQRAFAIRKRQLGPDHPDTATSLNNLADLYIGQGKYDQAEPLCLHALAICEQQLGPDHPDTAISLTTLANLYTEQGKYEEAEPLYQRALIIFEQRLGPNHPKVATCHSHFAALYEKQGKYEKAEPLYQRALTIRKQLLGSNHPETIQSREDYEQLLKKKQKQS